MDKIGRNDPCHCGSGKKYKNCHMNSEASSKGMNKAFVLVAILLALLTIGIIGYVTNSSQEETQSGGLNPGPPPPGEAPPGKVWSYEHGHWHNAF